MSQSCIVYEPKKDVQQHYEVEQMGHRALSSLGVPLAVNRDECTDNAYRINQEIYLGVKATPRLWCTLPQAVVQERLVAKNFVPPLTPVIIKMDGVAALQWTNTKLLNVRVEKAEVSYFFLDSSSGRPKWSHFRLNHQSRVYTACQDDIYAPYPGQELLLDYMFRKHPGIRTSGGLEDAIKAYRARNYAATLALNDSKKAA